MRGGRNLRHLGEQCYVLRVVVEIVVAYQAAEWLSTKLTVLRLIDLLEDRALVPQDAFVALQGATQLLLVDVEYLNLQHLIRLGVADQIVQPAPGTFQPLEVFVMNDPVHLFRELAIDLSNHALDRSVCVGRNDVGVCQSLLSQRANGGNHSFLSLLSLGLEFFVQKRSKRVRLKHCCLRQTLFFCCSHSLTLILVTISKRCY